SDNLVHFVLRSTKLPCSLTLQMERRGEGLKSTARRLVFSRCEPIGYITASTIVRRDGTLRLDCAPVPARVSSFPDVFGQPLDPAAPSNLTDAASCLPARPGSPCSRRRILRAGATLF